MARQKSALRKDAAKATGGASKGAQAATVLRKTPAKAGPSDRMKLAPAKTRVLISSPVMPVVVSRIETEFPTVKLYEQKDRDAFLKTHGGEFRAVVAGFAKWSVDDAFMAHFPNLEIISSVGVGYDHVDASAAHKRGVVVTNTPDVLTDEVADVALGLTIATVRRLPQADAYLRAGHWVEKGAFPLTDSLRGKTMGIVGLGRIGKAIAKRARAFGMKIAYHGRNRQEDVKHPYHAELVKMAEAVDILMVVTPGGAGTKHLINAEVIAALGPKGTLINVARGSVVDEAALAKALKSGKLGAAGLDVFEVEPSTPKGLVGLDNVVLLPHVASASVFTRTEMATLTANNILSWLKGDGPMTPVPETPWQKPGSGKSKKGKKKKK